MKVSAIVLCFLASVCLAQRPKPCTSPPLLSGALTVSTQNEKLWAYAKYLYDAMGKRIRLREMGIYQNQSFTYDALLLYREAVMYEIDDKNRSCKKRPLKADFHPMEIPKNADLLGQAIVGSSSGPGQGLLVNTWWGDLPKNAGKYMTTVTEFGCIPVSTAYQTTEFGWAVTSLFNNMIGISDPGELNPPSFCEQEDLKDHTKEEPTDFFSLFMSKQ